MLQLEKPELEVKKTELLHKEEELKIQLAELEESLLQVIFELKHHVIPLSKLTEFLIWKNVHLSCKGIVKETIKVKIKGKTFL